MANPKRRHSKSRTRAVLPHRVCVNCGYYKGRQVIEVEEV